MKKNCCTRKKKTQRRKGKKDRQTDRHSKKIIDARQSYLN